MDVFKMRKILQMIFCILSAISVVAAFFLGVFFGFGFALIGAAAALVFLLLTLWAKYGNPFRRPKEEPHTDFMNSEEENEMIRKQVSEKDGNRRE